MNKYYVDKETNKVLKKVKEDVDNELDVNVPIIGKSDLDVVEDNISDEPIVDTIIVDEDLVGNSILDIMTAYQNANKWLDTIKEDLLMKHGLVFFSTYIHNLAHTMPVRFDNFGDILHTVDFEVPYPQTDKYTGDSSSVDTIFSEIFKILDNIELQLNKFINATDDQYHGMACDAENLLVDIRSEYPALYRFRRVWSNSNGNKVEFDKFVCDYINNKDKILG